MIQIKQRKKFSLKEQYSKSWQYIKESKKFIFLVIILFFAFAFIGFLVPVPNFIAQQISSYIKELVAQTQGLSQIQLILFILFNNVKSSFLGWILGVLFGIFPVFVTLSNGYLLGFVANQSASVSGAIVLLKLLPHGIFELPAIFISLGMGIKFGAALFNKKKGILKQNFLDALRAFILVVIPLLIVAAIIEGSLIVLLNP